MARYKKAKKVKVITVEDQALSGLNAELNQLELERRISAKKRELKKEIFANKVGRATDLLKDIYHGAQAVRKVVSKAYVPESQARMKNMRKYLLNE